MCVRCVCECVCVCMCERVCVGLPYRQVAEAGVLVNVLADVLEAVFTCRNAKEHFLLMALYFGQVCIPLHIHTSQPSSLQPSYGNRLVVRVTRQNKVVLRQVRNPKGCPFVPREACRARQCLCKRRSLNLPPLGGDGKSNAVPPDKLTQILQRQCPSAFTLESHCREHF